jgi:DNA-3-methyladenine glycosylase II
MHASTSATLGRRDPTLRRIIRDVGPCTLAPRRRYFAALCEAIASQQLSTKAAATIYRRFCEQFDRRTPTPPGLLALSDATLRGVGLSRQKVGYLRDLARKFADGTVPARRLAAMDDDAVIDVLTRVKGIGVWTVQMFLIFVLNRPDVLPVDDLGLRKAVQTHYRFRELPTAAELHAVAERWRPYRSIATWYLWQSLNNRPMQA